MFNLWILNATIYKKNKFFVPIKPYVIFTEFVVLTFCPDGLTVLFIRQIEGNVIILIVHIVNFSKSVTVPDGLKTGKVVPIHKNGNKRDFANYRPISLVRILDKILEKSEKPTIRLLREVLNYI